MEPFFKTLLNKALDKERQYRSEKKFVKKRFMLFTALLAIVVAGCQKQEEPAKVVSPHPSLMQPAAPNQGIPQGQGACPAMSQGGDPHAGMKTQEVPPGMAAHKGKVLQKIDTAGYTYLEIEEKGQKLWVAVLKTEVQKGDTVEIPESPVMVNFTSKTLNRTFDEILFAAGIRVVKP
jgi:hypothetical protein